jgi:hypothetical protein
MHQIVVSDSVELYSLLKRRDRGGCNTQTKAHLKSLSISAPKGRKRIGLGGLVTSVEQEGLH